MRAALIAAAMGRRRAAPRNTVAAVFAGPIIIGGTSTITPGTWSGAPVLTYTLYRAGVADGTQVGRTLAQAQAYAFVAADIGPSLLWKEIPNGLGASGVNSNALAYVLDAFMLYDPTAAAVAPLNGSTIATLADGSAPAVSLAQATGGAQPTWTLSDANFNGQPSVLNAAGKKLAAASAADWRFLHVGTGMTIRMVERATATSGAWLLDTGTALGGIGVDFYQNAAAVRQFRITKAAGVNVVVTGDIACANATPHVHVITHLTGAAGGDLKWRKDRVQVFSGNNTAAVTVADPAFPLTVGGYSGAGNYPGSWALLAIDNRVLTTNEVLSFEAYVLYRFAV